MSAPITPGETTGIGAVQGSAFDPSRQGLLQQTLTGGFLPGSGGSNPFLSAAIESAQAPTALALNREVGRRIPGIFAQGGHQLGAGGSSPYQRALGEASFLGGRALGDIATNISFNAYEAERQRQQQGIQLGQQDVQAMLANLQSQGLPRQIQEMGIERALQTGQAGIQNLLSAFNVAQQYPLQTIANQTQSTGSATGASPNLLGGLFGNQGVIPYLFGNPMAQATRAT